MKRLVTDDEVLRHLQAGLPILDVRAPIEFDTGSLPGSFNLPLLDDLQRHEIGTVYKKQGSDQALALGWKLISGDVLRARVEAWSKFCVDYPTAAVMCFRGGQRSQLVQKELARLGFDVPLIEGGFKRVRGLLKRELEAACTAFDWTLLSGYTGSGKTELLRSQTSRTQSIAYLDLEKAARHRGSVFGPWPGGQPAPVTFENELGLESSRLLSGRGADLQPRAWLEDESRSIGRLVLPLSVFNVLTSAKVWVLERPRIDRARRLTDEYLRENYGFVDGVPADDSKLEAARLDIGRALVKIEKRLGGDECKTLLAMTDVASQKFAQSGAFSAHWPWVERLLEKYYDPLYENHISRIADRVVGRGPEEAFRSLANT
ncbi:tRNA 2-selenouridine(34) synthase MnmH [soil metagenome]